jgi:hypothetical protein
MNSSHGHFRPHEPRWPANAFQGNVTTPNRQSSSDYSDAEVLALDSDDGRGASPHVNDFQGQAILQTPQQHEDIDHTIIGLLPQLSLETKRSILHFVILGVTHASASLSG